MIIFSRLGVVQKPANPKPSAVLNLLGGSWVVISGAISRVTIVITQVSGLITPLITTHEPA